MSTKLQINLLPTGVPGLDSVLGGGIPEFSFNILAGLPGCGKTTLAHQIMFSLATPKRPALYITILGEPPIKMLRYQQQFDFFNADALNESVHFVNIYEETLNGDLDEVLARVVKEVEILQPALVIVDSFRALVMSSQGIENSEAKLQQFVQKLGMAMTVWEATTFLIGEYFKEADANPVFTVADGLIWLHQSVQRNSMVRKIEVRKMRGQQTIPGLHSFRITSHGIETFPPTLASPLLAGMSVKRKIGRRLSMGVAGLDAMLGGGLPLGYSLLIAGPSGSGKSMLASAFLAEGARCGETSVVAVFEQRPDQDLSPVLADLIDAGKVSIIDTSAPDLSIDEIVHLLVREIDRLKATRVVIDSLSGLELALAPTFRDDFRESLLRLVMALKRAGVAVVMTSELEDRYIDLRFSPYGTAFLTDGIIVQRYIEVESRLRRLIAVVKLRSSAHSDELREYSIDDAGIQIGATLPEQEGLLGGRPTTRKSN
ncbi:MAG: AAA family ATPase [Aeromicrobium sp.]|nr:AAA family ATPase [Burkholderiales bacterium]